MLNLIAFSVVMALILYVSAGLRFADRIRARNARDVYPGPGYPCSFKDFAAIETGIEERMPAGTGFLLGFGNVFWIWALDHVFPWVGGDYKLWLRTSSGGRILGWQGDGESRFQRKPEDP